MFCERMNTMLKTWMFSLLKTLGLLLCDYLIFLSLIGEDMLRKIRFCCGWIVRIPATS